MGEDGDVVAGGENSGVSGDTVQDGSVLIMDFTLHHVVPKSVTLGGRNDASAKRGWWIEAGVGEAERVKDLALAESVERFTGEFFERVAEDDETDVAVFGTGPGGCFQRGRVGKPQKF